ncbi:MAG TPA: S41 family peptidase [Pyrinomonadaceae bacterium]|nr:S41 family peptidase [Pyrinomonadaceae bacterium]
MKNKFSLALVALILFALTLPGFVLAQQPRRDQSNSSSGKTTGKADVPPATSRRARVHTPATTPAALSQDFQDALAVIQEHYIDGNKLDFNDVYKSSILGMLRSLDPHSNYFDRQEFEDMLTDQQSEYFGIGASILNYAVGNSLDTYITATFQNSPAWRAGLRYGDRIDAVDSISMHGKLSGEVRDKIRGPRGTHVILTLTRAATGKQENVEIIRNKVPQPSVPDAYFLRPGVGYIDMTRGFNADTAEGLESALEFLHARGMTSLVLDLRNNPGGLLDQAIMVARTFLPAGQVIMTQKGRNGLNDRIYTSTRTDPDRVPLVILVNEYTASASEIVAGAIQDHDRGLIVGQTSFGKGLVQSIIRLDGGAGLTLTSAYYYTPSGRLIQRDYSDGSFYNYIFRGGTLRENSTPPKPNGPAMRTDTGRTVYGGGGITPDETVALDAVSGAQNRLRSPIFFFARDVANGRVSGFDSYRADRAIDYDHVIDANDFPLTEQLFQTFRDYVAKDENWKGLLPQLDRNRSYIETELRFNLSMAAYGIVTAQQVRIRQDNQVAKAVDVLPRARELAMAAMRARLAQP